MSLYLIVLIALVLGAIIELFSPRGQLHLWPVLGGIFSAMLVLRFGQGTDYFAYQGIYEQIASIGSWKEIFSSTVHSEWGWKLLCWVSARISLSFVDFVACLSIFESILLYKFVSRYCPYKVFALLLIYPTFYLTYLFSGLRQGLVICIFLVWLFPLLLSKHYTVYFLGCLVCISIHRASCMFLFLPMVLAIGRIRVLNYAVFGAFILGVAIYATGLDTVLVRAFGSGHLGIGANFIAITERFLTYYFTVFLYWRYKKQYASSTDLFFLNNCLKIYAFGAIIYALCCANSLLSSRLGYPLKTLEIILICHMLCDKHLRILIAMYFIPLSILMCYKNIDSYLSQGKYSERITILNYPYVSRFDQRSIFQIRDISYMLSD